MGIIRFCLALIVLFSHAPVTLNMLPLLSGGHAVEAFFIISGFYIQLIIDRYAQGTHWKRNFYFSRLVRIFSIYWPVLLITICCFFITGIYPIKQLFNVAKPLTVAISVFVNIFIVGQEITRILPYDVIGGGILLPNPWYSGPEMPLALFSVVRQAWTLSPEILFYLLAPFLLQRKTIWIVILCASSLELRKYMEMDGISWAGMIFPCQLGLFLLGSLACRFYMRWLHNRTKHWLPLLISILLCLAYAALTVFFNAINQGLFHKLSWMIPFLIYRYFFLLAIALPFVFYASRKSAVDRFIGELSYPIYLVHLLIIDLLTAEHVKSGLIGFYAALISIGISIVIAKYIDIPLTLLRHRWFRPGKAVAFEMHLPGPT